MTRAVRQRSFGAHRVAGLALYRALLNRCTILPLKDEQQSALRNVVRNRFRFSKRLNKPHQLNIAFNGGYEALSLLDRCIAGCATSKKRIVELLPRVPTILKSHLRSEKPPRDPEGVFKGRPPGERMLDLVPRQSISGPRNVPTIVNYNGFYFLRFKKQQSPVIGRMGAENQRVRQSKFDNLDALLDEHLPLAQREDEWEEILEGMGVSDKVSLRKLGGGTYEDQVSKMIDMVGDDLNRVKEKSYKHLQKLKRIVAQERELAMKEQEANPDVPVRVRKDRRGRKLLPRELTKLSQKMAF